MISMNGNDKKGLEKAPEDANSMENENPTPVKIPPVKPEDTRKEAYGFKIGQKTLKMTVSAVELTRIEPDEEETGLGVVEVKYRLRWEGITGQGMEKDVTIQFTMEAPDGTEEVLLQQEMMGLMLEAKRRFIS